MLQHYLSTCNLLKSTGQSNSFFQYFCDKKVNLPDDFCLWLKILQTYFAVSFLSRLTSFAPVKILKKNLEFLGLLELAFENSQQRIARHFRVSTDKLAHPSKQLTNNMTKNTHYRKQMRNEPSNKKQRPRAKTEMPLVCFIAFPHHTS